MVVDKFKNKINVLIVKLSHCRTGDGMRTPLGPSAPLGLSLIGQFDNYVEIALDNVVLPYLAAAVEVNILLTIRSNNKNTERACPSLENIIFCCPDG